MQEKNTLMNADLYKPNSNKAKREAAIAKQNELPPKNVQKVVKGEVKSKEQSMIKRAALGFLADQEVNIKEYILLDVLIPTAKDTFMNVLSMLIYGDMRNVREYGKGYSSIYKKKNNYGGNIVKSPYNKPERKSIHDFRDVIFKTRMDAMDSLNELNELIEMYGSATVADFYATLWGQDSEEFKKFTKWTDREWGWTSLANVGVDRAIGGGYYIELPRAEKLD